MNRFLALVFSSGTVVGLSMAGLAIITNALLSEPISLQIGLVWFAITTGLYTANRLIEGKKDAAVENIVSSAVTTYRPFLLISSLGLLLLGIFLAFYEKIELGFLVFLTMFYFTLYTTDLKKLLFKKEVDV